MNQHQVTQLNHVSSTDSIGSADGEQDHEPVDSQLRTIKRQHQEALLKIRNERDILEEQDKLEEVKERVDKRREERKRESQHSEWVTSQKRELMSLQLQRAITKLADDRTKKAHAHALVAAADRAYDSSVGVLFCWDFVTAIPTSAEDSVQLAFAVYDSAAQRSNIKAVVSKQGDPEGPSYKRHLFAAMRIVKSLSISSDAFVLIEVSSKDNVDGRPQIRRYGWTAMQLFRRDQRSNELQLAVGFFKLPLRMTPMPDPSRIQLPITSTNMAGATAATASAVYLRLAHGDMEKEVQEMLVDPDTQAGLYRSPDEVDQDKDSMPASSSTSTITQPVHSPPPTAPTAVAGDASTSSGQDYLDLERIRLLSASSSSSRRPLSGAVRPRSTLSASGKQQRLGTSAVGPMGLQPVREDAAFDDQSPTSPWIRVDHSVMRLRQGVQTPFHAGDGFDVFIDGCRYLPDNVTLTKVTVAALHADRSKISPVYPDINSKFADLSSLACHPSFNLCLEYRVKSFNPTLTLIVRVDTIDMETKQSVILGYAVCPVFIDTSTNALTQPARSSVTQFALNAGSFQLPLHVNALLSDANADLNAIGVVVPYAKIPCATILIRLTQAATSEDGLSLLSRREVPMEQWEHVGLHVAAPSYSTGRYDSMSCIPTALEIAMYQARDTSKKRRDTSLQALKLMGLSEPQCMQLLDQKPASFIELRRAFAFCPSIGFRCAVDGLHNMKIKAGSFCKVHFSVSPPASFYQPIRLTSDLHLTTTTDWASLPTSPEFKDGLVTIRNSKPGPNLMLVIVVLVLTRNAAKARAYTSQPVAWTFLPILNDRSGAVAAGVYQLPLFAGDVNLAVIPSTGGLGALIDDIDAEKKKTALPFLDGTSVFVRLDDPQVPTVDTSTLKDAVMSKMIPAKTAARYQYDPVKMSLIKKKTPLSKQIPPGMTEKQMEKEINEALASQLGITHYSF